MYNNLKSRKDENRKKDLREADRTESRVRLQDQNCCVVVWCINGYFRPWMYSINVVSFLMNELQLNKDFVLRKVCGVNVVLPAGLQVKDFGGALVLNDTGALIYEQLEAGKTAEETAAALTEAYDVTPETALADVQETINSLREAGVVA